MSVCVRQNTYTNAEKLLEAADQLAQSGECEEEEIYQAARDLELRMQVSEDREWTDENILMSESYVKVMAHTAEIVPAPWEKKN